MSALQDPTGKHLFPIPPPITLLLLGLLLAGSTSGCATIVAGGPDTVKFTSTPPGAEVQVGNEIVGKTPVEASVPRDIQTVTMTLSGYEPETVLITRHLNGWVFGNILFGGIIGIIIDVSTENHRVADPEAHGTLKTRALLGGELP